jgi:competence protein ComEC
LSNGRGARLGPERLRRLGVTQIDLLVLTHRHPDHFGGTFRLVPDIPIKRCVVPAKPFSTSNPAWNHLLDELRARGVHCLEVHHGSRIQISDLNVEFLAPEKKVDDLEASASDDENLWSLAARIYSSDGTIWIFGDAPQTLEMDIMELNPTLPPGGVLLVPHHGSDTSSSEELLDGLQPDVAVVSHKRPLAKSVVDRYRKRRIPVCGTSPGGTVHLILRKGRIWVPIGCILR